MSTPTATSETTSPLAKVASLVALFAVTVVAFGRASSFEFVSFDDPLYVTENHALRLGLSAEGIAWALRSFVGGNWHPVTWLTHLYDFERYRLDDPGGHHMTSVWIHASTAVLLALALAELTGRFRRSLVAAALFALHPQRVESVAWISERKDVVSGFFFVATLLAYARYARGPSGWRYALLVCAFVLCLMSKAIGVTLPFVLLLVDAWPLGRHRSTSWSRLALEKAPLFALAIAASIVTVAAQSASGAIGSLERIGLVERCANAFSAYAHYFAQFVWPTRLACFYPHPALVDPSFSFGAPSVLAGVALTVLVTIGVVRARRARPFLAVGWFWFLGTLVPVIGFVQVGAQAYADRYSYVPTIGLVIGCVWSVARVMDAQPRLATVTAGALLLSLLGATRRQAETWRDSEALYLNAIAVTDRNYTAYNNLGVLYDERGDDELAERAFREAIAARPEHPNAWTNLGKVLHERGNETEAEEALDRALEVDPHYLPALYNAGVVADARGRPGVARDRLTAALAVSPNHEPSLRALERVYARALNFTERIALLERLVDLAPTDARRWLRLGEARHGAGEIDDAIAALERALTLDERDVEAHMLLGRIAREERRFDAALEHYTDAIEADSTNGEPWAERARTHREMGDDAATVEAFLRALDFDRRRTAWANDLAWILATSRDPGVKDPEEALRWARIAVHHSDEQDARMLSTLAIAFQASGNLSRARYWQEKAVERAPRWDKELMILRLESMTPKVPEASRTTTDR